MHEIDTLTHLLEPKHGLAREAHVNAIEMDPFFFSVIIDVGQRLGGREFDLDDRVGAWDVTLTGAIKRGVGEAVERYALKPAPTPEQYLRPDLNDSEIVTRAARLPAPSAEWYFLKGTRERHGPVTTHSGPHLTEEVWIPTEWIDYPVGRSSDGDNWFGTPSGTAAHLSLEQAKDSSLRELFERDAVTRAWYGLTVPTKVDPTEVRCRSVNKLTRIVAARNVHLYRLPSREGFADTYMAWHVGSFGAAAGSSLASCPGCAMLHAAIEAVQVSALLRETGERNAGAPTKAFSPPSNFAELSSLRMGYWAGPSALESWHKWDDAAKATVTPVAQHSSRVFSSEDVARAGFSHVWVDLTARLPRSVNEAGFRAVKSIIPEIYALPMSEGEYWNQMGHGSPYAPWEPLL